jgi:hypothetical protein
VTALALPESKEALVERIGLDGAQAMVTIVKVNPDWQFRPGRVPAELRMVLVAGAGGWRARNEKWRHAGYSGTELVR